MRLEERLNASSGVYFDGVLIDSLQTPWQLIEVFETPDLGRLMRIDGANMVSEKDEFFYHENLVHPVLLSMETPRDVLIVGGGDGGTAEEVLKHPSIERVVLAELDAGVIEVARKHFASAHRGAFDHPKLQIRIGDGAEFVGQSDAEFDAIFLDLTDPIGPAEALYSQEFFQRCKHALRPEGALVLHLGSPFTHAPRVRASVLHLRAHFRCVRTWFVHIPMYGATWGFASASDRLDPGTLSAAEIDAKLVGRNVGDRQYYNGETHAAMFALPEYVKAIIG